MTHFAGEKIIPRIPRYLSKICFMLEFSKMILRKVSFDKKLFKRELEKNIKWLNKKESAHLKVWALSAFVQYRNIILNTI